MVKKYLKPFPVKIFDFNISQENVKLFQVLGCFSVKLLLVSYRTSKKFKNHSFWKKKAVKTSSVCNLIEKG